MKHKGVETEKLPQPVKDAVLLFNKNDLKPLYKQLYNLLLNVLMQQKLPEGSFFATEQLIMNEVSISRSTIRKALEKLEREKYIIRFTGKGTFVSIDIPSENTLSSSLKSMTQEFEDKGMEPGTIFLETKIMKPTKKIAEKLQIDENDNVLYIERIRTGNGFRVLYIEGFIPLSIINTDINQIEKSLYKFLEINGYKVHSAEHVLTAVNLSKKVSEVLGVKENEAALKMNRVTFNANKIPLLYEEGLFRSDLYRYTLLLQNDI